MDSSSQDKDLPATERRLEQARSDGQVARSKDLSNLAVLGGGFFVVINFFSFAVSHLIDGLRWQLRFDHASLLRGDLLTLHLQNTFASGMVIYLPIGAGVLAMAVGATIGAGGWTASLKPVMPDLSKVSPLSGFGRVFSKQQLVEVAKLTAMMGVIGVLGWLYLSSHLNDFASLALRPLESGLDQLGHWLMMGIGGLLLVVAVMAAVDVPLALFLHKQRLKMSHQEVKQEHKETEGNPQLKGRMRSLQRQAASQRSLAAVPKADLVVMNPTHYAVAIRYDEATMVAPRVIAKGADLLAMRIRDVAKGNHVPVLQSPMLARALYANAEIDAEIPPALYTAVAQVLAYVYQVKAAMSGKGAMPKSEPVPDVPPELDPHHPKAKKPRSQPESES